MLTLRQILEGKNNVCIKEFEPYFDTLIFVGGCYYANNNLIIYDGNFYMLDMVINAYEWKDDNTLLIVREKT